MKLSERIRPDVEAAPWVIDAIKSLESELETAESFHRVAVAERNAAWAEIESIKAAPPVPAVPEGWSGWAIQYPGKLPKLYGAEEIARMNWSPDAGADLVRVVEVDRVKASDWAAMLAAANKENTP